MVAMPVVATITVIIILLQICRQFPPKLPDSENQLRNPAPPLISNILSPKSQVGALDLYF